MLRTPDLMRDRHLDQLIMCCIYVMAKVLRLDITFQEIMRQYRHQPQAKSHVRSVSSRASTVYCIMGDFCVHIYIYI